MKRPTQPPRGAREVVANIHRVENEIRSLEMLLKQLHLELKNTLPFLKDKKAKP